MTDVLVLGAGLAGLAAARDLAAGGADVVVLEARERPGGRVEQIRLDGGRPVQLGGEVVGPFHTAYLGLVEELGLTLEPSYTGLDGLTTYDLLEGVVRADDWPFATPRRASRLRAGRAALRRARRHGRPRRPLVAPGRGPARPRLARRVAALRRRAPVGDPLRSRPARSRSPDGSIEHTLAARGAAQVGRRPRGRASTTTTAGSRCRWPREAARWRSGWRPRSATGSATAPSSRRSRSRRRGCSVRLRGGETLDGRGGRLRAPGRAAARRRGRRRRTGAARLAARPAACARGEGGVVFDRSVWADVGANGLSEGEGVSRLDVAAARGRALGARAARAARRSCSPSRRPTARTLVHDELERDVRRRGARDARRPPAPVGHRPVHAGLRDAVVARAT